MNNNDRDEKGRFKEGHGSIKSKEQARRLGAKGGSVTKQNRIEKWIEAIDGKGAHPITKEEAASMDRYLLSLTRQELQEVINAPLVPIIVQARAKQLADIDTTFDATEKLLDRAFGKPKQQQDVKIGGDDEQPISISFPKMMEQMNPVTEEELYDE